MPWKGIGVWNSIAAGCGCGEAILCGNCAHAGMDWPEWVNGESKPAAADFADGETIEEGECDDAEERRSRPDKAEAPEMAPKLWGRDDDESGGGGARKLLDMSWVSEG